MNPGVTVTFPMAEALDSERTSAESFDQSEQRDLPVVLSSRIHFQLHCTAF